MGLTDEQVDSIIDMHSETVDALKEKLRNAEDKAAGAEDIQKELDDLKAKGSEDYKDKYKKEHEAFEKYKSEVIEKEQRTSKEEAVKAYFESKGITGANLTIAMRGVREEISAIELDENKKIKSTNVLDNLVSGEYAGLVSKTSKAGAETGTPPSNNGGSQVKTKADIMKIKDTSERQKAIAENIDLFRR